MRSGLASVHAVRAGWVLRSLAWLAMAIALGGCPSPPPPSAPPPVSTPETTMPAPAVNAIAAARAARDHAYAMRPPSAAELAGASDKAAAGHVYAWLNARRDANEKAQAAYTTALRATLDPAAEAALHSELADLWLRFEEDTRDALQALPPAPGGKESSLVSSLRSDVAGVVRPLDELVSVHLEACKRMATISGVTGGAAVCDSVAHRFMAQDAASAVSRPVLPTSHPKPCTFKGTLFAHGTIYGTETGTTPLMAIGARGPIEVEALEPATRTGGRYKVTVSWPKPVEGYLEAQDPPFTLLRRVELVPTVAWAPEGARMDASDVKGPTARVLHPYIAPAGGPPRRPKPEAFDLRLFCHDLGLATAPAAETTGGPSQGGLGARGHLITDVAVPIAATPGGPPVAEVVEDDVDVLERQGDYVRISGTKPFEFDGWVDARFLKQPEAPPGAGMATATTPAQESIPVESGGAPPPLREAAAAPGEEAAPRFDAPVQAQTFEPDRAFRVPTPGTTYILRASLVEGYDSAVRELQPAANGGQLTRASMYTQLAASLHMVTWSRETDRQELGIEVRGQHYVVTPDADDGTIDALWAGAFTLGKRTTMQTGAGATLTTSSSARLDDGTLYQVNPYAVFRIYSVETAHLAVIHELSPVWRLTAAGDVSTSTTLRENPIVLADKSTATHTGLDYATGTGVLTLTRDFDPRNIGTLSAGVMNTYLAPGLPSNTATAATAAASTGASSTNATGNVAAGWTHIFDERLRSLATLGTAVAQRPPLDPGNGPIVSPTASLAAVYTSTFWTTSASLAYSYGALNPAVGFGPSTTATVAFQGIPFPHGAGQRFSVFANGVAMRSTLLQSGENVDLDYVAASIQGRYAVNGWCGIVAGEEINYTGFEQTGQVAPLFREVVFAGISILVPNQRLMTALPILF